MTFTFVHSVVFIDCLCVCLSVYLFVYLYMWWLEDNLQELVLSFHYVVTRDWTQEIRLWWQMPLHLELSYKAFQRFETFIYLVCLCVYV